MNESTELVVNKYTLINGVGRVQTHCSFKKNTIFFHQGPLVELLFKLS